MKHIVKATLHNYRGYEHEEITFTNGLNVIWGIGDGGKSALEKALRWATTNETQGNFINKKIKTPKGKIKSNEEVYVKIEYNTGEVVKRLANANSPHYYYLGNTSMEESEYKEFEKVGNDMPDEIASVLNMSDLNVQKQFDSFFLLHLSGGDVAKELNKMVNLEIIDTSKKKINSIVSSIKKEKDTHTMNMEALSKELDSYSFLEQMLIDLEALELSEEAYKETIQTIGKVSQLIHDLQDIEKEKSEVEKVVAMRASYDAVMDLLKKVELTSLVTKEVAYRVHELEEVRSKIDSLSVALQFKDVVEKAQSTKADLEARQKNYNKVSSMVKELREIENTDLETLKKCASFKEVALEVSKLKEALKLSEGVYNVVCDYCDDYTRLSTEKVKVEAELKELRDKVGTVCPTCGRVLDE